MPATEADSAGLCSFVSLESREFAAGVARADNGLIAIDHFVHVAGKEFDDCRDDLKAHAASKTVHVETSTSVTIVDAGQTANAEELTAKLTKASGFSADNILVTFFDKETGEQVLTGHGHKNTIAAAVCKATLLSRKAEAASIGAPNAQITIRALNAIGAIRAAQKEGLVTGAVLCVSILKATCQLFSVSENDVEHIGDIDTGHTNMLLQIMTELGLKFEGSAARLFFGNIYDFDDKGDILAAPLSIKIKAKLDTFTGMKPQNLMLCGLPPLRTALLSRHIAPHLGLTALKLPTVFVASSPTAAALPVLGTPEFSHLLKTPEPGMPNRRAFLADFAKVPADIAQAWKALISEHSSFVRIYRGTAIDEDGNPVEIHHETPKISPNPAPGRKIVRWYRGNPVYEDELDSVRAISGFGMAAAKAQSAPEEPSNGQTQPKKPERKIVRIYRGNPIYEDEI